MVGTLAKKYGGKMKSNALIKITLTKHLNHLHIVNAAINSSKRLLRNHNLGTDGHSTGMYNALSMVSLWINGKAPDIVSLDGMNFNDTILTLSARDIIQIDKDINNGA